MNDSARVGSKSYFRIVFLEVSQERAPGGHPGTRFLKNEKTVCSLMKWRETNFENMFLL